LPGEGALLELEHALLAFEMVGPTRRATFEQALQRYVDFYLTHIRVEETEVLPLAERRSPSATGPSSTLSSPSTMTR
jgi:hypothetical protein